MGQNSKILVGNYQQTNLDQQIPDTPIDTEPQTNEHPSLVESHTKVRLFFCSTLLRCDLHKKKVPGRTPYSQHIMIRNWT